MIEAIVAITVGVAAGSIALVSFGFDSTVEVMSSVVVWQFCSEVRTDYDEDRKIAGFAVKEGTEEWRGDGDD